jgi:hypothetical protein
VIIPRWKILTLLSVTLVISAVSGEFLLAYSLQAFGIVNPHSNALYASIVVFFSLSQFTLTIILFVAVYRMFYKPPSKNCDKHKYNAPEVETTKVVLRREIKIDNNDASNTCDNQNNPSDKFSQLAFGHKNSIGGVKKGVNRNRAEPVLFPSRPALSRLASHPDPPYRGQSFIYSSLRREGNKRVLEALAYRGGRVGRRRKVKNGGGLGGKKKGNLKVGGKGGKAPFEFPVVY